MHRAKSDYAIQTVTNALRLLEAFAADEELGVTQLSRRLDLHKNNVFRLLATLEEKGYVEQSSTNDRYRLGTACLQLGQSFSRAHGLRRRARAALEALAHETGETTHLGVLRGFEVLNLDGEQPSQGYVFTRLRVGQQMPSHCTALGKVLLGCAPGGLLEDYDREVMSRGPIAALTARTIVDREKLIEHLRVVGVQGWALDLEEFANDLACAAAPIHDATGQIVAALSVSAPASRLDEERLQEEVVPAVQQAAAGVSRALGYRL